MSANSASETGYSMQGTCVRLAILILLFVGSVYLVELANGWDGTRFLTARIATELITHTGVPATCSNAFIFLTNRNLLIATECLSVTVLAVFYALVLIYPAPLRHHITGILIGTPLILFANLLRLTALAHISLHLPHAFDFLHKIILQGLMGLVAVGLWALWIAFLPKSSIQRQPKKFPPRKQSTSNR